jgi:sulfatase maturation enzyme AslB (radical SAM superfamily)
MLKEIPKNNVFCILPWVHFHALPNKKVLPCCMAESNLPVSTTDSESIISMMNTEEYRELRKNMLNGIPTSTCNRCYDLEKVGQWSLRQSHNTVRGEKNLDLVNSTEDDGSIKNFKLEYMDIRWSNICNMKCRSCGPEFSSLHAKEYIDKKADKEKLRQYFNMDDIVVTSNKGNKFFKNLKPYLKDVEEVYFAGGESLITPEHYQTLDEWIAQGKTDIDLSYTTNFSVFKFKDKNVIDYWKQFKSVQIFASLDGMGKVGEYLRSGTDWKEIEDNIKMIKKEVPHVKFHITPTISTWNVYHFPEFFEYMVKKGYIDPTDGNSLRLNMLTHPWWASVAILPQFYKDRLYLKWDKIRKNENYHRTITNSAAVVQEAFKSETRIEGLKEFFDIQFETDKMRKEKLFKAIPELEEVHEWLLENL